MVILLVLTYIMNKHILLLVTALYLKKDRCVKVYIKLSSSATSTSVQNSMKINQPYNSAYRIPSSYTKTVNKILTYQFTAETIKLDL